MGLSLGRIVSMVASAVYGYYTGDWSYFIAASSSAHASRVAKRDRRRAIQRYNDSLQDRLEMLDLQPDAERTLVLGRVRYVEGVRRRWSSGTNDEQLTMVVSFAGHEIDAFEQFYLFDTPVTLDVDGWVQTAPWMKTAPVAAQDTGTLNGSGSLVTTLSHTPSGAVGAVWTTGSGDSTTQGECSVSMAGAVATITGGQAGASVAINYQYSAGTSLVRLRPYLGTSTQNVGADLAAEYPGEITSADEFAGIALVVMDCIFDPDVFPQGRPTLTAVMRGAKVYDPRLDSTEGGSGSHRADDPTTWEWSESPPLLARHFAAASAWGYGWALPDASLMSPAEVATQADVADVETEFTVRLPDDSTDTYTLPRYRCGITIRADSSPDSRRAAMDAIMASMAGSDGWDGGVWRFRAGHMAASAFTLDTTWLAHKVSAGGKPSEPVIRGANAFTREQRVNRITGSCIDPAQRYQALPYPAVEDAVLVAAQGERAQELSFEAVNHVAHAQHLASIAIRDAQAGLRIEAMCDPALAYRVQLFDVGTLLLPRFGMDVALGKTAEVIGRKWSPHAGIKLQLAEISEAMFEVDDELTGRDPAPDSNLRPPWDVETLSGLSVTSATAALTDAGSVLTRTAVSWTAAVGANIRQGGRIEVQYRVATDTQPSGEWPSWEEPGDATSAVIPGLMTGRFYVFRVRAVQMLPRVRGPWSAQVVHKVGATRAPTIYRQDAEPTTGVQNGDQWFDTNDGNKHYIRQSGAWVSVRDSGIAQALLDAAAAQATADGKIDTYWQTTAPGSASEGDIWFDTDDGYKQYRRTSGAWVVAADTRIGQAISDAADAQATADGKVVTFVTTSAPTAEGVGDLWLDSDDGYKMYRWSGSSWVSVRDSGIAQALLDAAAAQATADGKIDTYWQATPPGSAAEGDIWFDTDDGYKQYRWTSGAWVVAADTRIGQAISDAADAQATADGKVVTFVQISAPTATAAGDLWFDSDDGYKLYRWSGSAWVSVRDAGIAQALADAADAQATADGKIDTFWQTTPPAGGAEGDIWFDTDDGYKQYRYTAGAWTVAADTRIGQAINDASDAQATADGKVTTFLDSSPPTAEAVGDLWLDTDDGNKLYRWNGGSWVPLPIGTGGIDTNAATEVDLDDHDFAGATTGSGVVTQRTVTITPTVDCVIEFTAEITATNVYGDGGNQISWTVTPSGGSPTTLGGGSGWSTAIGKFTCVNVFVATGGVALDFKIVSQRSGGPAMAMYASIMRITQIKR